MMGIKEKYLESKEPVKVRVHESPHETAQTESRRAEQKLIDIRGRLTYNGASADELAQFEAAAAEFRGGVEEANKFLAENLEGKPEFLVSPESKPQPEKIQAEAYPPETQKQIDFLTGIAEILEAADYPRAAEDLDARLEKIRGFLRKGKQDAADRKLMKLTEELKRIHPGLFSFENAKGETEPPEDMAIADVLPAELETEQPGRKAHDILHRDLRPIDPESKTKRAAHVLK